MPCVHVYTAKPKLIKKRAQKTLDTGCSHEEKYLRKNLVLKGGRAFAQRGIFSKTYGIYSMTAYYHHIKLTSSYFNYIITKK